MRMRTPIHYRKFLEELIELLRRLENEGAHHEPGNPRYDELLEWIRATEERIEWYDNIKIEKTSSWAAKGS